MEKTRQKTKIKTKLCFVVVASLQKWIFFACEKRIALQRSNTCMLSVSVSAVDSISSRICFLDKILVQFSFMQQWMR